MASIDLDVICKLFTENLFINNSIKDILVFKLSNSIFLLLNNIPVSKVEILALKSNGLKFILIAFKSKLIPLLFSDILFLI